MSLKELTAKPNELEIVNTIQSLVSVKPSTQTVSRRSTRTKDERRLLGWYGDEIDDPDAVPISTPTTRVRQESMPQGGKGGFRPRNTLVSSVSPVTKLFTRAVHGDNLSSDRESVFSGFEDAPLPKRIKTTHLPSFQDIQIHKEVESDGSDELGSENQPQGLPTPMNELALITASRASSAAVNPSGLPRKVPSERRRLEDLMDSNSYVRDVQAQRKAGRPKKIASLPLSSQSRHTDSTPIDLTGVDKPTPPKYQGTARPSTKTRQFPINDNLSGRTDLGANSKFFNNHSQIASTAARSRRELPTEGKKLSNQFVPEDGKRRSSHVHSSPDELAAEFERDSTSRLPPRIETRQESPLSRTFQQRKPSLSLDDETGPDSSSIKPTTFTEHKKASHSGALHPKRRKLEKHMEGYELTAAVVGNEYLKDDNGLGLVFNDAGDALEVHYDGTNLSTKDPAFRLQLQKLKKLIWAPQCTILRLESARIGNQPWKMDAKFASEAEVTRLMRNLVVDVSEKTSWYMDKLLDKSISEVSNYKPQSSGTTHEDPDLDLLLKRKERRDGVKSEVEESGQASAKRRRAETSMVHKLTRANIQNNEIPATDKSISTLKPQTNIDQIMKGIFSKDSNLHTTRSKSTSETPITYTERDSPLTERHLEEQRYSKEVGLGPEWKRPLIYPQLGKKKTTVEFVDLERLDEGQFLNDNLICFYMRYLECQLEEQRPEMANKVYWFNTYFFASLTQTVRGKRGINYDAVRKWTRNVDVFTYDYAVVPINESAHWYVAIICNLRALDRKLDTGYDGGSSSPKPRSISAVDSKVGLQFEPDSSLVNIDQESGKTHGNAIELDKADDEDASESFAELQLHERESLVSPHAVADAHLPGVSADQEQAGAATRSEESPILLQHMDEEVVENTITTDKALATHSPATQKRAKRKSMPSPRVFDVDQPAIITLDSLGIAHSPTVRVLKDYLREEAKDKRGGMEFDDSQIKGITVKKIPTQTNYCDCGLFLLEYIEKFVRNPTQFVSKILQREAVWPEDFHPSAFVPSAMRTSIRVILQDLHAEQEIRKAQVKKTGNTKVLQPKDIVQQSGPSNLAKDDSQFVSKSIADDGLQREEVKSEGDSRKPTDPNTRRDALQSALRIDEAVPDSQIIMPTTDRGLSGYSQATFASHAPFRVPEELDVLGSQEGATEVLGLHNHATHENTTLAQQPADLPLEIPDTPPPASPPRPHTRGKPRPDPEMENATAKPAIDERSKTKMASPRESRKVISISDN